MVNKILQQSRHRPMFGRPAPDAAWRLLGHGMTGYDWHGGYYAAPRWTPAPAERRRARRDARELEYLGAHVRRDAGLPEQPARPRVSQDTLWQRVASWAQSRVPGDPCPDRGC